MREETITIPKSFYEAERKMRFFGTNSNGIYNKKFNIFIGISISNKNITSEMAYNYLKWAVGNTKSKVAVVIADELNIVNYEIFDKYSKGKAENRAKKVGDYFEKMFKDSIKKLSEENREKVKIYRWKKIREDEHYIKIKNFLEEEYKRDYEFRLAVLYFVKKYMRKKGKIISDEEKIDKLATYILSELPTLIQGIFMEGVYYKLCIYPTYFASGMSQFVMDMHANELDIGKKLKDLVNDKAVLVEAWLD